MPAPGAVPKRPANTLIFPPGTPNRYVLSGFHGVAPSYEISHSIVTDVLPPPGEPATRGFIRIRSSLLLLSMSAMNSPPTASPSDALMRFQLPAAPDEIAQRPLVTASTSVTPSPSKSPNRSA